MNFQQRYILMMRRQRDFRWGDEYVPSTLATVREAPKGSRVSRLNSRKLGRTLHALSTPERVFTLLALHHPRLFDFHEQKMLSPSTTIHPLYGHPLTRGIVFAPMVGTLEIAQEIGLEHSLVLVSDDDGNRGWQAFPYQGDLLLYIRSPDGIAYAVNWTIKYMQEDFTERRRSAVKTRAQLKKDRLHADLRQRLEEEYYARGGIRTIQLTPDMLDPVAVANLNLLWGCHTRELTLEPALLSDFSSDLSAAVKAGTPPFETALRYAARWGSDDQFRTRIYQDIWNRSLQVNLLKRLHIDHPLAIDGGDLIEVYRDFFQGTPS